MDEDKSEPDMITESLDTTQNIGSELLNVELAEVIVGGESLGRKWKTGEKKVRFEEDFDETTAIDEKVSRGSPLENILQDEGLVEESEIINVSDGKDEQKTVHEESEDIAIEEVNKREAETNDPKEAAAEAPEAQITPIENVDGDEVLLPDAITPSIKLFVFNIILPTIDIFLDAALVQKLVLNGYWGCASFVTAGIFTNFLFTSIAWWGMEATNQKRWSWIFLMLQLWPQLRALQVQG